MAFLRAVGVTIFLGSFVYMVLLFQEWIAQSGLPGVNPKTDAYSKCMGDFLTDMATFVTCLDSHAGKKCIFDSNRMTNSEDAHNCLALITPVPNVTFNALVITAAHDVCYSYLRSIGECLGLAVEMEEFGPCFRREVFARVGRVVDKCKNETGVTDDDIQNMPATYSFREM